jgi:hypothetical protein
MADFGFYYPDHTGTPTATWEPSLGPRVPSSLDDQAGVISDTMADGVTQYDDVITVATDYVEWTFAGLVDADRTNFRTFRTAMRAINPPIFQMLDPMDSSYKNVRFAPGGWDPIWEVQREFGARLGTKIRLRLV